MKYTLNLKINDLDISDLIEPEICRFDKKRSQISIEKNKQTIIKIIAHDAVALRATADTVFQLLKIYEKTKEIK